MLRRSAIPDRQLSSRAIKAGPQEAKNIELAGRSTNGRRESADTLIDFEVKKELEEEVRKGAAALIEEQRKVIRSILDEFEEILRNLIEEDKKEIFENAEALTHSILEKAEAFRQSMNKMGL
jgi:hypothetical protein